MTNDRVYFRLDGLREPQAVNDSPEPTPSAELFDVIPTGEIAGTVNLVVDAVGRENEL